MIAAPVKPLLWILASVALWLLVFAIAYTWAMDVWLFGEVGGPLCGSGFECEPFTTLGARARLTLPFALLVATYATVPVMLFVFHRAIGQRPAQ